MFGQSKRDVGRRKFDMPFVDDSVQQDMPPEYMSEETYTHYNLVSQFPMYWETRMWHPVIVRGDNLKPALEWLGTRGQRGTPEARNDWLHPWKQLILIRETELAVECKLKWGGTKEKVNG